MDLPKNGSQDRLVEAVLQANPRTVIVNQSGSPVGMPWADRAPAILQAWYQGQEAGNALADVLFGKDNPCGKLPTTFPKQLEDNPAFGNWPGENLNVRYEEGVFVGYRHYEKNGIAPLFPFGHGLSYTSFAYSDAQIDGSVLKGERDVLTVSLDVRNTGTVAGAEVVQVYVYAPPAGVPRPEKELKAFTKVRLEAGQSEEVHLKLDKHAVGFYDMESGAWKAEAGTYEVQIGSSSVDIRYVQCK